MRLNAAATRKPRHLLGGAAPLLALLALAVTGCGSSSTTTSSTSSAPASSAAASAPTSSTPAPATGGTSASGALSLEANAEGQLKYDTTALSAKAGAVSIDFKNASPLAHNVTVASSTGAVLGQTPTFEGATKTLTLTLKPGVYKFYCTVPGHRAAGMEGTLTVH